MDFILVFAGGAIGALIRELLLTVTSGFLLSYKSIFFINVLGCMFFGLIAGIPSGGHNSSFYRAKLFLTTGLAGGFTTFSTFSFDCFRLINSAQYAVFAAYLVSSVFVPIFAVYLGIYISGKITSLKEAGSKEISNESKINLEELQ